MNKFTLAIVCGGIVVSVVTPAAHAQGFKIRKDSLEQVDWFHGKRQAQIVDDDMEIRDLRRRPTQAPYVEIRLAPINETPELRGATGTSLDSSIPAGGLRIGQGNGVPPAWKTTLPESGFGQSYIPARRLQASGLQPGYNTGVHASLMQARSAATDSTPRRLAERGNYIKPPVKSYPRYNQAATGSGNGQTNYNSTSSVYGRIKPGSLLKNN